MLKTFEGGVRLGGHKESTAHKPIKKVPMPDRLYVPMVQHIGTPCQSLVVVGDIVQKGQLIGKSDVLMNAYIHAPTSGKVVEIAEKPHPLLGMCETVVIDSDGQDQWLEGLLKNRDWHTMSPTELIQAVRAAGVVGLGGAAFPTHVKLSPPPDRTISTLVVNAAECEPYLTADHRCLLEYTDELLTGVLIAMKILSVDKCYIGVETNKADAIKLLQEKLNGNDIEIVQLACKYPQGGEKSLIQVITGREVPSGGLPMDVGCVVHNVGTLIAIKRAVVEGIPLIERVVTISGSCVPNPQNLLLPLGTSFADALELCGGLTQEPSRVLMGAPMMGIAQYTLQVPVIKGTSGITTFSPAEVELSPEGNCIRCGSCVQACPIGLEPQMLSRLSQISRYEQCKSEYNLLDCIECGCCVYVCPARRYIVQHIQTAKRQVAAKKK